MQDDDDDDDDNDDSRVWKAKDWKSNYSASVCLSAHGDGVLPSDAEFRDHFEKILNPTRVIETTQPPDLRTDGSIPVL